jgi:hypothetical protein
MLIRDHGLRPTTPERLAAVARDAIDALVASVEMADDCASHARDAELAAAIDALVEFRVLRRPTAV